MGDVVEDLVSKVPKKSWRKGKFVQWRNKGKDKYTTELPKLTPIYF